MVAVVVLLIKIVHVMNVQGKIFISSLSWFENHQDTCCIEKLIVIKQVFSLAYQGCVALQRICQLRKVSRFCLGSGRKPRN